MTQRDVLPTENIAKEFAHLAELRRRVSKIESVKMTEIEITVRTYVELGDILKTLIRITVNKPQRWHLQG